MRILITVTGPIAYHVTLSTYGFWLPNDPRGSWSTEVRSPGLRPFGPATTVSDRRSVAHATHNITLRLRAKKSLKYPAVRFDGLQALSVANGFAKQVRKSGYIIHACAILPSHVHLVIRRHSYDISQIVRLLRQSATMQLLSDGRHPFAAIRTPKRLVSVWGQSYWEDWLYKTEDVPRFIKYVENNPVKEGKRRQRWSFVVPFDAS
jgi:REP element-mobilizing transposase RayT